MIRLMETSFQNRYILLYLMLFAALAVAHYLAFHTARGWIYWATLLLLIVPFVGEIWRMLRVRAEVSQERLAVRPAWKPMVDIPLQEIKLIFYEHSKGTAIEADDGQFVHLPARMYKLEEFTEELATRVARLRSLEIAGDLQLEEQSLPNR